MAMTLPIPTPCTPSNSPPSSASDDPRTPLSPTMHMPASSPDQQSNANSNQAAATQQNGALAAQMKRKPSRRANTAERRATHNAVERQRRETLNGRFLDLAALLPNLSQIRRPSKSSIVNSSIAHIHASRRHRLLAARELRLLKLESDALRRELNEWRDRAALPRVEEPVRGEGFGMILSGEIEVLAAVVEEEEGGEGYDGYEGDDDFAGVPPGSSGAGGGAGEDVEDARLAQMMMKSTSSPFAHAVPPTTQGLSNPISTANNNANNNNAMHLAHMMPRHLGGPMIAPNPPSVSFENPAMAALYEPATAFSAPYLQHQQSLSCDGDNNNNNKWGNNNNINNNNTTATAQLFNPTQQLQPQRTLFTPPSSAASAASPFSSNSSSSSEQDFFASFQRQQQQMVAMHQAQQQRGGMGHMFGASSPGDAGEDASSVGSRRSGGRERSGSLGSGGSGGGYVSPPRGSPMVGGYEPVSVDAQQGGEYGMGMGMPKRFSVGGGLQINTSVGGPWGGRGGDTGAGVGMDGMGMGGMMKHGLGAPISVGGGGGGNGGGFAMMMM